VIFGHELAFGVVLFVDVVAFSDMALFGNTVSNKNMAAISDVQSNGDTATICDMVTIDITYETHAFYSR